MWSLCVEVIQRNTHFEEWCVVILFILVTFMRLSKLCTVHFISVTQSVLLKILQKQ